MVEWTVAAAASCLVAVQLHSSWRMLLLGGMEPPPALGFSV